MFEDDQAPLPAESRRRRLEPLPLATLGVAELQEYIGELQAEIARAQADMQKKRGHRSAADALFKMP